MGKPATTTAAEATDALLMLAVASMLIGGLLLMGWSLWLLAVS
jgi:hypothetical protein